jgi:hypothetical protein
MDVYSVGLQNMDVYSVGLQNIHAQCRPAEHGRAQCGPAKTWACTVYACRTGRVWGADLHSKGVYNVSVHASCALS